MVENYILGAPSLLQTHHLEPPPLTSLMPHHISSSELTILMQNSLAAFFKEHQIQEVLPDNAKVI
jgi:hypothetical protein